MKIQAFLFVLAAIFLTGTTTAQSNSSYQIMSRQERSAFVAAQARRISRELSGRDYEFTAAFEEDIQQSLDAYARRLAPSEKREIREVMDRGRNVAPTLNAAFRARKMSPLYGLYIPFIESEFINIQPANQTGATGMFQFMPATGENYGLTIEELLDASKSADAAARYLTDSLEYFKDDPMKEALAILSYNRGTQKTRRELNSVKNDHNRACSICALNADRSKLDETFRNESAFYVPRFFAAAIMGENPHAFGLSGQRLSSY